MKPSANFFPTRVTTYFSSASLIGEIVPSLFCIVQVTMSRLLLMPGAMEG